MGQTSGMVIVVDDDAAVRESLKFSLELEGLSVRAHESGSDMLANAPPESRPACLVVDYFMPEMDGVELVERLRRRAVDIPAILITAKPSPELRARAAASGIDLVLEKPLEDAALLDGIRSALAGSGASLKVPV